MNRLSFGKRKITETLLGIFALAALHSTAIGTAELLATPSAAVSSGYLVHAFSSHFAVKKIDKSASYQPGFEWYSWNFFWSQPVPQIVALSDGGLLLDGFAGNTANGELATAAASPKNHFGGTAFGGGGYFEASLAFNPQDVIRQKFKGWPSWWSMALEHIVSLNQRWPGQAENFAHFIEPDFFEYDLDGYASRGKLNYYGGALHDWYGLPGNDRYSAVSTPYDVAIRQVPVTTDFGAFHRYGFLWIPATPKLLGRAVYYFDGEPIGKVVSWSIGEKGPPPAPPTLFGVLDRQHLVLVVGTGFHEPMKIRSVDVWQISSAGNLTQ